MESSLVIVEWPVREKELFLVHACAGAVPVRLEMEDGSEPPRP